MFVAHYLQVQLVERQPPFMRDFDDILHLVSADSSPLAFRLLLRESRLLILMIPRILRRIPLIADSYL